MNIDSIRKEMLTKTNASKYPAKQGVESCSLSFFAPVEFIVEFKTMVKIKSMLDNDIAGRVNIRTVGIDMMTEFINKIAKELKERGIKYESKWQSTTE
jgi:hypothetical protein